MAARCAGTRARCTLAAMTVEIGGFLALAALMIGLFAWLRTDISRLDKRIDGLRQEMQQEIGALRQEMRQEIGALRAEMDGRLRAVEHGQARLEGLLEGLREAIAGRSAA